MISRTRVYTVDAGESQMLLKKRLVDLVEHSDTSVRLKNCMIGDADDITLPFLTISDYLSAGGNASELMKTVHHLGNKSAYELDQLVRAYAADNDLWSSMARSDEDSKSFF